jgi:hypothetical protein
MILILREIFFPQSKHIMGHNRPLLRSGQLRGQKGLCWLKKSQEMPHYMFCLRQKNNPLHFQNQRDIGIFMSLREREREQCERERESARREMEEKAKDTDKEKERDKKCGHYM